MATLGYAVTKEPLKVQGSTSYNVVADKVSSGAARRLWIVCAHLDSINDASDSGVAGALEIAEILAPLVTRDDLRIVLFGREEQGSLGSRHYVASLSAEDRARC